MSSQSLTISKHQPTSAHFQGRHPAGSIARCYFVVAFLLVALLMGVGMVIHGQAVDDQPIRAFLQAPEGCAAPCFMGVRPGVTLGNEAQTILQTHPWVQAGSIYVAEDTTRRYIWMSWRWSADAPAFLSGSGYMTYSPLDDGRIRDVDVRTTLPFGAVWLALGMPDAGSVGLQQAARYSNRWLFAETSVGCGRFWQRATEFYMVAPKSLVAASDLLHVQPYEAVLRARGCTGQKKP